MDWTDWVRENTDPSTASSKPEALAGLRVLDLGYGSFAGLFASSLLSESGARVIRVEPLEGDIARRMTPFGRKIEGAGLPYLVEGRNKEHITLNIKKDKGKELLRELVKGADILLETGFPGTMDEAGIGWNALKRVNPRLIYVALTSYGQVGELSAVARMARWRCYDSVAQALSGVASTTGMPDTGADGLPQETKAPTLAGGWMGWYAGGAYAAVAVMAALFSREMTGTGQFIDISPAEALMNFNNYALQFHHLTGTEPDRTGNMDLGAHPYCYFRCKDGMVFLSGYTDEDWRSLCGMIGREDLALRYATLADRTQYPNAVRIVEEIERFTLGRTRAELVDMWRSAGKKNGVAVSEVLTPAEASEPDHWRERQALVQVEEAPWGKFLMQGIPVKMSETPPRIKWVCRKVGADNESVYGELLGLDREAMDILKDQGII